MKTRTVYTWHLSRTGTTGTDISSDGGPYAVKANAEATLCRAIRQTLDDNHTIRSTDIREHQAPANQRYMEQIMWCEGAA